jgi:hypothetical protein
MANVGYDIDKALKTPEQCRVVMERALAQGNRDLYAAVFRRFCKLSGAGHDDPSDPLEALTSSRLRPSELTGANYDASARCGRMR